jgi:hypothetical protein
MSRAENENYFRKSYCVGGETFWEIKLFISGLKL